MTYHAARTEGTTDTLIFTFHGTGGSEAQFHDFASGVLPGAHVVSPRGDVNEMGALRYFSRTGEGVYDMDDLARRTDAMADFLAAEVARIGTARVIGLGYSNGANIIASVMLSRPEIVAEAVLLHPLIPWSPDPVPGLSGRRVLITAGERDPICPPETTRALADYLAGEGVDVTEHWHPGGHDIARSEVDAIAAFLGN